MAYLAEGVAMRGEENSGIMAKLARPYEPCCALMTMVKVDVAKERQK
jgi:hypothetical protein